MSKKKFEESTKKDWEELKKNPINQFKCKSCNIEGVMSQSDFKKHLLEVHNIDASIKHEAKKRMILHLDGDYWFSSTYEWEMEGIKFYQQVQLARQTLNY